VIVYGVRIVPDQCLPRAQDRFDRFGEHGGAAAGFFGEVVGMEEVEIRAGEQVASVGEGRDPLAVGGEAGVPSDVVGVQMGTDDEVDLLGLDARGGKSGR